MPQNAGPRSGDVYLKFNGTNAYVEVASIPDYSVSTTGDLTVSVWMRPDTLNFPRVDPNSNYIHWLGKGDTPEGNEEWTFRMYNHRDHFDSPPRPNRISFYLFNPEGGLGVGSYVQAPVTRRQWIHVVGIADAARTYFYKDGQYIRCDTYRGPAQDGCEIHYQPPPNESLQLIIDPTPGPAPLRLGTKDLGSFLEGGLTRVRMWDRVLTAGEVSALYTADTTPRSGLVAEFLLNADTGTKAIDTAQGNDGTIVNAVWATE